MPLQRYLLKLEDSLKKELVTLSKEIGMPIAEIIRQCIRERLPHYKWVAELKNDNSNDKKDIQ